MSGNTILGISPGARFTGIAVIRDTTLVCAHVRSFQGKWSDAKLNSIVSAISETMEQYDITDVTIKVPDVLPLTKGFHQLIGSVNVLCESKGIKPWYYSLTDIKSFHCKDPNPTLDTLMSVMVEKHPELVLEHRREQSNRNAYYHKVFEAVAVAHMPVTI